MTKKISNLLKSANAQKNFKIMKLVALFLTIGMSISYAGNSYSQVTTLNLKLKNKTVREVFNEIEKNSEYVFLYNRETLDPERVVSINAKKETISDVLDKLFEGTDNTYKVSDRQVYISKAERQQQTVIIAEPEQQQKKSIRGTIVDQNGEAIIGANIMEKGTTNGTVTDMDGRFSLNVENNAVIQISYIGYLGQDINTEGKTMFNIVLLEDMQALDEVVVVGFGTQKKANLTGAVAMVSAEKLENRPIASVGQGLQGLIPNMNVTISDGSPTTSTKYNIRGFTSINGGDPLILVDGTPMDIDLINPNDIANVVVLKDASASSIYGARAAFGVILIETKQGRTKKARITFSTEQSLSKPIFKYDPVTDPYEFKIWWNKANMRTNGANSYSDYSVEKSRIWSENPTHENAWEVLDGSLQFYGNNDYQNRMLANFSPQQKYDVSISKTTDDATFYVSLGHLSKDGYIKNDDWNEKFKRYNVLMKSDIQITPWLSLDDKIAFNAVKSDKPHIYHSDVSFNSVVRMNPVSIIEFPDLPYYLEPGDREKYESYIGMYGGNSMNQFPYLEQGGRTKYTTGEIYLTQGITLTPIEGLKIRGDFTYHTSFRNYEDAAPNCYVPRTNLIESDILTLAQFCTDDYVENRNNYQSDYQLNTYIEYETPDLNGHNLKGMIGFNQEYWKYSYNMAHAKRLLSTAVTNVQATVGNQQTAGSASEVALRGIFFRLNYNFMEKYLLEFSGRYDGTSRFPKDSRFGFFPWRPLVGVFRKNPS